MTSQRLTMHGEPSDDAHKLQLTKPRGEGGGKPNVRHA